MKQLIYILAILNFTLFISCNSNEEMLTPPESGLPAVLRIDLQGEKLLRATGSPNTTNESKIGQGIILVFKGNVANPTLDGKASFDFTSGSSPVTVNITAGPYRHIYVIANVNPNDFASVAYVSDLYNLTNKAQLTAMRSGSNLAMSGSLVNFDATTATTGNPLSLTVPLSFVGSRIHLDWDLSQLPTSMNGFTVTGAYLLNVKNRSDYFAPSGSSITSNVNSFLYGKSNISGFSGSYLPVSPATNVYDSALAISDLVNEKGFTKNYFYVLENTDPSSYTIATIEGVKDGVTYYYPIVINGDLNGSGTGGNTNTGDGSFSIKRGKIYYVNAIIKGFGTNDPYATITKGAVDVTITPATWAPAINIDQEFN